MIIALLIKYISQNGDRKYLIDGFPRNINDILVFEKMFKKNYIQFKCFINIDMDIDKIIENGVENIIKKDKNKTKEMIKK